MRSYLILLSLLVVVCVDARTVWLNNWNCKNMHGTYLDVRKMLAVVDLNKDNIININEDRASYSFYDTVRDGRVTRNEFVNKLMKEFCYPKAPASQLFDLFDTNKDNILTPSDTNPQNSLFDQNGNVALAVMMQGLREADKIAQSKARQREFVRDLIVHNYDGYHF